MSISTSSSPRSRPVGPIHTVVAVRVVLAIERSAAHRLAGLSELLDNRRAERRKVRRRAAGGQLPVDDDLLIQDLSAGTTQVAPQARPGREPAASHRVGLQQRPRAVTHRSDRLTCRHEGLHEVDRVAIDPQLVGVHRATWKHQRVIVVHRRVGDHPSATRASASARQMGTCRLRHTTGDHHSCSAATRIGELRQAVAGRRGWLGSRQR